MAAKDGEEAVEVLRLNDRICRPIPLNEQVAADFKPCCGSGIGAGRHKNRTDIEMRSELGQGLREQDGFLNAFDAGDRPVLWRRSQHQTLR